MKTLSSTPDPRKAEQSAEIAEQVAAYEALHGKVQTSPLRITDTKAAPLQVGTRTMIVTDEARVRGARSGMSRTRREV